MVMPISVMPRDGAGAAGGALAAGPLAWCWWYARNA
jgi:hypothetical protein